MTADEIVKIIRECAKSRVISFKQNDLDIVFGPVNQQSFNAIAKKQEFLDTVDEVEPEKELSNGPSGDPETFEQALREANLVIEDPAEWERQQTESLGG